MGFNWALFRQVACLSTVVAVRVAVFTAVHSNVTNLATPVTFHLIAKFLNVTKPTTGVALLLIRMVTVTGHMASFAAGVAQLLPLFLRLLAVPGNVATPVAVVARIFSLVTVACHVSLVSTPIAEQLLASSPAPATATTSSTRTVLDPMPGAATSKAFAVAAHLHYKNSSMESCCDRHRSNFSKVFAGGAKDIKSVRMS